MATPAELTTGQISERHRNRYNKIVTEATTARAITSSDIDAFIVCSAAGATTLTIPESTTAAGKKLPIGTEITAFAKGAGGVTWAKTGSDTLTGTATAAQNIGRKVVKVAATEWVAVVA
jgi:hypothetical protein